MKTNTNIKSTILLASLLTVGCSSEDEVSEVSCNSGVYPFIGCWLAQDCVQGQNATDTWVKSQFKFTSSGGIDGDIKWLFKTYNDSSCSGVATDKQKFNIGHFTVQDDPITIPEGLNGHDIVVILNDDTSVLYRGYIVVTGSGLLCTSSTLQFNADGHSYTSIEAIQNDPDVLNVNFDNCLRSGQLP